MTGLIFVVFGDKFDHVAAHTLAYSRRFTKLPINVITNVPESERSKKWAEVPDIDFTFIDLPTEENRQIKTLIINHTPFTNTLYLDADSIIQNESFDADVERYFEGDFDILINYFCQYPTEENKFQNIYWRAFNQFGCEGAMNVYNGAIIGFKKTERAKELFARWNVYWAAFGRAREMPPFACAIMNTEGLKVNTFDNGFFSPCEYEATAVVQHNSNESKFLDKIGLSSISTPDTPYSTSDYLFTQL